MNCQKTGCSNPGRWNPVLLLYAPKKYNCPEPIRSSLNLAICDECSKSSTVSSFLCDEGWAQIISALDRAGKVRPQRDRTQLAWEPIGAFDARASRIA